jgi:hypothetical protein
MGRRQVWGDRTPVELWGVRNRFTRGLVRLKAGISEKLKENGRGYIEGFEPYRAYLHNDDHLLGQFRQEH